jgi:hypothetical protein
MTPAWLLAGGALSAPPRTDDDRVHGDPNLPPAAVDPGLLDEQRGRWTPLRIAAWVGVALLGGLAWVMIALVRGETVNAIWFVFAGWVSGFRPLPVSISVSRRARPSSSRESRPANEGWNPFLGLEARHVIAWAEAKRRPRSGGVVLYFQA